MRLTKTQLRELILQEIKVTIGGFLEEDNLGDPNEVIGGGNVVTKANVGSQPGEGGGMASISESGDDDDDPSRDDMPPLNQLIADLEDLALLYQQKLHPENFEILDKFIESLKDRSGDAQNQTLIANVAWDK